MAISVALFTRAWIEIRRVRVTKYLNGVALFTRAWIEMFMLSLFISFNRSPSLRGRGLKYKGLNADIVEALVALFTRAWIEILNLVVSLP